MAFTYLGDLSTDLDKTRFYLGDTDSAAVLFTDAEINGALALNATPMRTAAALADAQAAKYARRASMSIDGASFRYGELSQNFRELATRLRTQAVQGESGGIGTPSVSGVSIAAMDAADDDTDREPSRFKVGMMDNPGSSLAGGDSSDLAGDDNS